MKIKSLFVTGLSCLTLGGLVAPALASDIAKTSSTPGLEYWHGRSLGPQQLVDLGRQGFLNAQGIPSNLGFSTSVKSGKINSQVLVKAGIDAGRLSPNTINNSTYLSQVQSILSYLDVD
ncbi:hypothetical protein [Crocosphaera sp. Alani8]|uniref:hypothetical protein n=1 Tax=Crocosphaera sp. Alani8 TaxID=3038952 RepID=UPI00313B9C26